ncbi:hypothetical protein, partial [Evtepia sp.]
RLGKPKPARRFVSRDMECEKKRQSFLPRSLFLHSCHRNGQVVQLLLVRPTRLAGWGSLLGI